MSRKNRNALAERVVKAAEAALAAHDYVSPVDVLVGIGWLDAGKVEHWRRGQIDCLERAVQTNLPRIAEAMKLLRSWAMERNLSASPTHYVARGPQRQTLHFSRSGDPAIEAMYRTHWVSQALSEKKRERLAEKASRAPDLVVIQPLNREWTCHRCCNTGDLLMMENPGPACLACVGLDDLEFLPAGDALLSRRVKAKSTRCAVVVRFSRSRRRYERQGLLVERWRWRTRSATSKRSDASDNLPWTSSIGQSPPASHPTHNASVDAALPKVKNRSRAVHENYIVISII